MDITNVLANAQSPEPSIRQPAEQQLRNMEQSNFPQYLALLCEVLANPSKPAVPRQLAGVMVKNTLVSKEEAKKKHLQQRWMMMDAQTRGKIKECMIRTLGDQAKGVRSTAAQCVGKIAGAEVGSGSWPNLVETLLAPIIGQQPGPAEIQQASFQALGYVCEECPTFLQAKANLILNAVARGMHSGQTNIQIKLAATRALTNALEFVRTNMSNKAERDQIMTMVCQATACPDIHVQVAAYNCLVEVVSKYYDVMPEYMKQLFMMTGKVIQNGPPEVSMQAIEFWSTLCEEERDRIDAAQIAAEMGRPPPQAVHGFAKAATGHLVPLLLQDLTKQSPDVNDDTWNEAMAAGTCLQLFAQAVQNDIVKVVLPFVEKHMSSPDWRLREAATLAFGAILDGPSKAAMADLVTRAFPHIINFLGDQHKHVKDTAAWTIGRICDILPETINEALLRQLMQALVRALDDQPNIASHICWAIHNLADAVEVEEDAPTSPLSPYFHGLVSKLLQTAERKDSGQTSLLPSAYEAINLLIQNSALDAKQHIVSLIPTLAMRLKATLTVQGLTGQERELQNEVQGLLCGALQTILMKLDKPDIAQYADHLMQFFLQVLQSKNSTVMEEAMMAVGAVANVVEGDFVKYMPHFKPYLLVGLRNFQEYQVCIVAVGVVGDICRALEANVLQYCDEIMQLLLSNLQNQAVERSVKPHIIACISDVALAVGGMFERYLPFVMMLLVSASSLRFPSKTDASIEYLNLLRRSILEAYTGIIQGLAAGNKVPMFMQFLPNVVAFLNLIAEDPDNDDEVLEYAAGFIGDLASLIGGPAQSALSQLSVAKVVRLAMNHESQRTKERGQWAAQFLQRLGQ